MRIVNRKEFLSLPTPFMYIKCDKWGNTMGELAINCGTTCNESDWISNSCIFEPEFSNSEERYNKIIEMVSNNSLDIPVIDMNTSRDGLFESNQLFIIYSENDFKLFTLTMQKYLSIYMQNKSIDYIKK